MTKNQDSSIHRDAAEADLPERLYGYVLRISGRSQILLTFVSAVVFGLSFVPLELQRQIVNGAIELAQFEQLVWLCLAYFVVVLVQGGAKYLMNVMRGHISETAIRDIRLLIRGRLGHGKPEDGDPGQSVSLVSAEVEPLGGFIGESVSSPLVQSGTLVTILAYLTWIEPLMATVAILLFVPQLLFIPPMQAAINARVKDRIEILRETGDLIVEAPNKNKRYDEPDRRKYSRFINRIFDLRISIFRIKFAMKFLINFLNHLATIGTLFIGGWLVLEGKTEVGTIVAFLAGLQRISEPGRMLVSYFRQLTDARVRYDLIRGFFKDA